LEFTEVHMGVPVRIVLFADSPDRARAAARSAFERVAELDDKMSDFRPGSEVNRIAAAQGAWTRVSPELLDVLSTALLVARASAGAYDPTAGPLVTLWREARRTGQLPGPAALDSARARTGWEYLALDTEARSARLLLTGGRLDLGGVAKGYILQAAGLVLRDAGVRSFLVEAGGDVYVADPPPGRSGWTVDVPGAGAPFRGHAARLSNQALATSGSSAQHVDAGGRRYSHVVDPRTGMGVVTDCVAHVIAGNGALADALATALLVAQPSERDALLHAVGRGGAGLAGAPLVDLVCGPGDAP
jgi:thiamine biosynthesis lipoprotein